MSELWPPELPQCFLAGSVQWSIGDGRLRTPMEAGPAKVRRRTSATSSFLSGQMKMTSAQKSALLTFVNTTVQQGDTFLFPDPDLPSESGNEILVRFADQLPSGQRVAQGLNLVSISLEVLP